MDPDGWPVLSFFVSAALTAVFFLVAGVYLEQSGQKELADSGVGISLHSVASLLLCAPCLCWAAASAWRIGLSLCAPLPLPTWARAVCRVGVLLLLALGVTVFCVFLPLAWGRARSERYLRTLRAPLWFAALFVPLARLVTAPARGFLRARGVAEELGGLTEEDVLDTVDELEEIDESQKEMIGNIFELDDVRAGDLMTHRTEIEAVPAAASLADVTAAALEHGFSRLPVYEGTLDHIVGVLFVKDLLRFVGKPDAPAGLSALWHKPLFVPESCRARDLMIEFKQNKIQLAVVVDEYGGTAGIVSMEDILESIVGDIEDEYDEEDTYIVRGADGVLICDGFAEIEDVFETLGLDPPDETESDTIGGLLTALLKRIPAPAEHPSATYAGIELTALKADDRRITSVRVRRLPDLQEAASPSP